MKYRKKRIKGILRDWRKLLLLVFLVFSIYSLSGFLLLPWLLKTQAEKRLPELLKRQATIAQVRFNPYTLRLQIDGFEVKVRQGEAPFLKIDSLLADLAGFLSLKNWALVLEELDIQGPYLKGVRNDDLSYNFSDLLPVSPSPDPEPKVEGRGFKFSLNNIKIGGGVIEFDDLSRKTSHRVDDITIGLPWVSNLSHLIETHVQPSFAAVFNGTSLAVKGKTKPFTNSHETLFHIDIDELDLPYYLSYLPGERNFTVADGSLTTRLDLVFIQPKNEVPRLTLSGTATLNNLLVSGRDQEKNHRFVFLPEVITTFGSGNLLDGELFLSEVVIRKPEINLFFKPDGVFHLPQLIAAVVENPVLPESGKGLKTEEEKAKKFIFKLDHLSLEEGIVTLRDGRVTPVFAARFAPVDFELKDFSNSKDHQAHYELKLQSEVGEILAGDGDFSIDPVNLKTRFSLDHLPMSRYVAYYQDYFVGQMESGTLRLGGEVLFAQTDEGELSLQLNDLECGIADLKINTPDGQPVLELPQLLVAQSRINIDEQRCVIGSIEGEKGSLTLVRGADNILNLDALLPPPGEKESLPKEAATETKSAAEPWQVLLEKGRLQDFQITFKDHQPVAKAVINLDQINLELDRLSTVKGESGTCQLELRLAKRGRLSINGSVILEPLKLELDIDLQKAPLKTFQAYLSEHLDLVLVRGDAFANGHLSFQQKTEPEPRIVFTGKAALVNVKTVDGWRAAEVLSFKHLYLNGISFRNQPPAFSLSKVSAKALRVNFVKESDGRSNLEMMLVKKDVKAETSVRAGKSASSDAPLALKFKKIELAESSFTFLDRSLSPSFKMVLSELEGGIEGLTSIGKKPAEVKLAGRLNSQAPISVSGFIDPLAKDLYVDLKITGQGLGMTDLTPYTGKYVGYTVGKGKLSLDLDYKIENQKLKASNAIFLDQFGFGSSVESPDATSLPVKLAVALLRDRQGEIHLNLPVSGELDDPDFSLGGIIIKVFFNLIAKAVTSPFALIGSLVGGGEELNLVTFAAGQVELDETAQGRLDKLAGVLYDRPGLKVEIVGRADAAADRQVLHEEHFRKLLQAQKFKRTTGRKDGSQSIDEVVVEKVEFEDYLWRAYKVAPFAKEKNMIRMIKKIEPVDQERLLRDFVKVSDDELLQLARNRARQVMAYIAAKGPVEAQRLFLVDPQVMETDPTAVDKARQVEMKIQ